MGCVDRRRERLAAVPLHHPAAIAPDIGSRLLLLLINAFQAFDEFFNISTFGPVPAVCPPLSSICITWRWDGVRTSVTAGAGAVIPTLVIALSALVFNRSSACAVRTDGRRRPLTRARVATAIRYAALILGAILFSSPSISCCAMPDVSGRDLGSPQWYLPPSWHPENFTAIFNDPALPMARNLVNSVAIAIVQNARRADPCRGWPATAWPIPYRWSNAVFYLITATLLIPAAVTFVPSFVLVSTLGWISTLRA